MSTNTKHDWSDDPRLTAYAFGELEGEERAAFEAQIAGDDAAQAIVAELRALGATLEKELAVAGDVDVSASALTEAQRGAIEERLATGAPGPRSTVGVHRWTRYAALAAAVLVGAVGASVFLIEQNPPAVGFLAEDAVASKPAPPKSSSRAGRSEQLRGLGYIGGGVQLDPRAEAELRSLGYTGAPAEGKSFHADDHGDGDFRGGIDAYFGPDAEESEEEPILMDRAIEAPNREAYAYIQDNPFIAVASEPLSTFSIDVDTASYANVRRMIENGQLPPKDAVRLEEFVNYFPYSYGQPETGAPFAVDVEVGTAPWAPKHKLVRIGIEAPKALPEERKASNLVFLLDVSGSMNSEDKLPLLKKALHMLVQELGAEDTVSIVVYAGASGLAMPATRCSESYQVHMALERLNAGGSTNGGAGIELAYQVARENYIDGGINRVILATDGDFNIGVTDDGSLVRLIEEKAKSGVFLSVLGFGRGNLQDSKMESLADKGNGNYAYIDSVLEAKKVLVDQLGATLETVAKDVKVQVEFNPAEVEGYRLIGYENRLLEAQDFNDDTKDAGEIGAGHTVTALYEVVPKGVKLEAPKVDALRYQKQKSLADSEFDDELLFVKLRYKQPEGDVSTLIVEPVLASGADFQELSGDTRWATAVAAYAMVLRDSPYKGTATIHDVQRWALESVGDDRGGYRAQFIGLVGKTKPLFGGRVK